MKVRKTLVTLTLALALVVTGTLSSAPGSAQAAQATKQYDEYNNNSLSKYIKKEMNQQLVAYFSGSSGKKAKIKKYSKEGFKSIVNFTFSAKKLKNLSNQQILWYIEEAINDNPNLCTLSTAIAPKWKDDSVIVGVKSVVKKADHAAAIRQYKQFLANIEYIPKTASKMSDTEILLYLHDRVVQHANYALGSNENRIYIPYTMSDDGAVVCQSYAAVLNQLMRDLGFVSYAVWSSLHAWNVVKLDGKWTNIDATWDDPIKKRRDFVMHKYFLVPLSSFKDSHNLNIFMSSRFPGLGSKAANEFTVLPKSKELTTSVCFRSGMWFYVKDGRVYRWDGSSAEGTLVSSISQDKNRCVNTMGDKVFIGGSDGFFTYDPDSGKLETLSTNIRPEGLLYFHRTLYYLSEGYWYKYITYSPQGVTYETLNGTGNVEKYKLVKPGKPLITASKSSAKSIRIAVSKAAENANGGYQVQVATNSSFTSNKMSKTISGTRVNITGLTAGRTYYVRVRGIWKSGYLKKYGEWSVVKKG